MHFHYVYMLLCNRKDVYSSAELQATSNLIIWVINHI